MPLCRRLARSGAKRLERTAHAAGKANVRIRDTRRTDNNSTGGRSRISDAFFGTTSQPIARRLPPLAADETGFNHPRHAKTARARDRSVRA